MEKSDNLAKVYSALSNPYRRQRVQALRERGRLGFKELHEALKINVGALYHHLDMLEGIVVQDSARKYTLTNQGRSVIDTLSVSEEKINHRKRHPSEGSTPRFPLKRVPLGRTLFNYLNEESLRSPSLELLIIAFGSWLSSQTRLEPLLLFYVTPFSGSITTPPFATLSSRLARHILD